MSNYMRLAFISVLFALNIDSLRANCNVCSAVTQMACVSETEFQVCVNNVPTGAVNSCPSGFICSTATAVTCQASDAGFEPTCNECNKCNADMTFACTGTNTYALCLGTNTPSPIATGSCGDGLVCNFNLPEICADPADGTAATCPTANAETTTTTTTTTVAPTLDPPSFAQNLCETVKINARMSLPADMNMDCKNYVYCFLTANGTWSGQIYTCAGSTYFDDQTKYCMVNKPPGC
uniref:Chitin-binding type-2 domain-containing protein n=1 Tax=Stomoxys calcitrans TaxID=35570 RepID=A0A1I8NM42_STOCA